VLEKKVLKRIFGPKKEEVLIKNFKIGNTVLNTILFVDQATFSESGASLQRAVNRLENIADGFNMRITTMKTNHGMTGKTT
jgi:hypothetical protein